VKADAERTATDKKHARRLLKHKLKLQGKAKSTVANVNDNGKGRKIRVNAT
jgi:hypothetical protein